MAENDDHEIPNSLQPLAAALTKAGTVEGVADALVREGLPALNACVAVLALLNDEGTEFFSKLAGARCHPDFKLDKSYDNSQIRIILSAAAPSAALSHYGPSLAIFWRCMMIGF